LEALMDESVSRPLADAAQNAFKKLGRDVHVWKHVEHQSVPFEVGVRTGGQGSTNKLRNPALWERGGKRYDLLRQVLYKLSEPFLDLRPQQISTVLYEHGVRIDEQTVEELVREMRSD
jgi:hypothetical protein